MNYYYDNYIKNEIIQTNVKKNQKNQKKPTKTPKTPPKKTST